MTQYQTALEFIDDAKRASSSDELAARFGTVIRSFGFDLFACMSHFDYGDPPPGAVRLWEYPEPWTRRYIERKYFRIDPVLSVALRSAVPFLWSDKAVTGRESRSRRQFFDEAAESGLVCGYTVPIHTRGVLPATVNVVGDWQEPDKASLGAIHLMSIYLHDAGRRLASRPAEAREEPPRMLTDRERECLRWVALGKSDWDIGGILSISEKTAHFHVENAKRKLGVGTRVQAVVQAFMENQILP